MQLMIEKGANANVVSPNVKPFKGKSCFMHRYGNDEELDVSYNWERSRATDSYCCYSA